MYLTLVIFKEYKKQPLKRGFKMIKMTETSDLNIKIMNALRAQYAKQGKKFNELETLMHLALNSTKQNLKVARALKVI
jgi:hypothetical protein